MKSKTKVFYAYQQHGYVHFGRKKPVKTVDVIWGDEIDDSDDLDLDMCLAGFRKVIGTWPRKDQYLTIRITPGKSGKIAQR